MKRRSFLKVLLGAGAVATTSVSAQDIVKHLDTKNVDTLPIIDAASITKGVARYTTAYAGDLCFKDGYFYVYNGEKWIKSSDGITWAV